MKWMKCGRAVGPDDILLYARRGTLALNDVVRNGEEVCEGGHV